VAKAHPALQSLTPMASGVLAVRLSANQPDYLMWFRKEQLLTVTWAGDPSKPMVTDDPLELSPRRSFAAWSEIVRSTALPWTSAEEAMGRAIGAALIDIIVQVHGVRLLIAEHQRTGIHATLQSAAEAVVIADGSGRVLFRNAAFDALAGPASATPAQLADLALLFTQPQRLRLALASLGGSHAPWRGELVLARAGGEEAPVAVRAEAVTGRDGAVLGFIVTLFDLRDSRRAAAARRQLELTMEQAAQNPPALAAARRHDGVLSAILTNASLAAMDIADAAVGTPVASLLQELEASTQRAADLYQQVHALTRRPAED
jgi:PAS domain-containing protein